MKVYGLASLISGDVDEWCSSREEAEALLEVVIADAPELAGVVFVTELELAGSVN